MLRTVLIWNIGTQIYGQRETMQCWRSLFLPFFLFFSLNVRVFSIIIFYVVAFAACSMAQLIVIQLMRHSLKPSVMSIGNMAAQNQRWFVTDTDKSARKFRSKEIRAHLVIRMHDMNPTLFAVDGKQYVQCERCRCRWDAIIFIINAI